MVSRERPETWLALSQLHRRRQRPQEALEPAERALALTLAHRPHGHHAEPWVYQWGAQDELATVYSLTGRTTTAADMWTLLLDRAPPTERERLEANIAWARGQS